MLEKCFRKFSYANFSLSFIINFSDYPFDCMTSDAKPKSPSAILSIVYGAIIYFTIGVTPFLNLLNFFGVGIAISGGFSAWHLVRARRRFGGFLEAFGIGLAAAVTGGIMLFFLHGGSFLRLLYDIAVCAVVGGISGVISASVVRRGLPQNAETDKSP